MLQKQVYFDNFFGKQEFLVPKSDFSNFENNFLKLGKKEEMLFKVKRKQGAVLILIFNTFFVWILTP